MNTEIKQKVLIADQVDYTLVKGLEGRGYEVIFKPSIEMKEVKNLMPHLSGVVINTRTPVNADLMKLARNLRWIARLGSGLDIIDLNAAERLGIEVINSPEGNANAVGEHILGMLLSLLHNINKANLEMRMGKWLREENRGIELSQKTVGIIGFGNTGSAFAKLLSGFGCEVLAYDKYKQHYSDDYRYVVEKSSLWEVLDKSEIVSLHLPLTSETKYLADDQFFQRCRKGAVFINTSRGKIVNTKALLKNLKSGWIRGACLDVFENENPSSYNDREKSIFSNLFGLENVIATPHVAGWTVESKIKIAQTVLDKLDVLNRP